jgi:hypothetical protein
VTCFASPSHAPPCGAFLVACDFPSSFRQIFGGVFWSTGYHFRAWSSRAGKLSTLAELTSSPSLSASLFCGFISCFITVFKYYCNFVAFSCVFLPLILCICCYRALDALTTFYGILSIWLQIVVKRCSLNSMLEFSSIGFISFLIGVFFIVVVAICQVCYKPATILLVAPFMVHLYKPSLLGNRILSSPKWTGEYPVYGLDFFLKILRLQIRHISHYLKIIIKYYFILNNKIIKGWLATPLGVAEPPV